MYTGAWREPTASLCIPPLAGARPANSLEGTTLPTCAKVFAENAINQVSESFVTSRSELSTTGYSRESIPPQDTSTTLVLPEMVEGNPKCELVQGAHASAFGR